MKKILFITGTRADYGKLKPLMKEVEASKELELNIFVSGMHLLEKFGNTYKEVLKDGYKNVYIDFAQVNMASMSYDLGVVISDLTSYVQHIKPDMIVVHGDRIDALAGALVGVLNNIIVTHIEGGEFSGTIDESIRHAISKLSHIHMVSNDEAKKTLCQMGENEENIFIIGSPDIDLMLSENLPSIKEAKKRYEITFKNYGILMYHPVTTEIKKLRDNVKNVVTAVINSGKNFIVIYPNNDMGSDIILREYERFIGNERIRMFPSVRFEYFLTLMKNADFVIGNSSAGVRETGIYGIPAIDIGTRQQGRYSSDILNVIHVNDDEADISRALSKYSGNIHTNSQFGTGKSASRFIEIISDSKIWNIQLQKKFKINEKQA